MQRRNEKENKGHVCKYIYETSCELFHQQGEEKGSHILLIGESPAASGWHEGKACRAVSGKLLASGKRLDELLEPFGLSTDICGFTELSKCCVDDRRDLIECSEKCWPLFIGLLEQHSYKLLVLLGVHTTTLATKLSGIALPMGEITNATVGKKTYAILPIYHPSPINPQGRARNKAIFLNKKEAIAEIIQ
ncbi:MAG: hypothetical protein ACD_81C00141G0007 [uncultured bacterium]|uniref:Uracil-DNA glycosylase-like domain-containing protein n=2 Tax=Candidatus Wolfeibacteriota TaxID=1752735 RepID=A0A0G1H8X3_9BACT|nr:MAG: hypothetical protein ACD_81C00141G0007 [uncultured bacterium]KKR12327.1 MAG: hypothetical protein UT41_C0002G0101 [Candidatus Wolfebacteria bacterium GW2011_GWC2_39_22]KKT43235.1 MAG: hypothetical protein UW32_C0002G0096 [Candidatus Wolfebacteria bacterium GW2011_GWE2_44_13]HBI25956.1 hypothetical protein [Candidatus Wolfebacteria bacterium]